MQVTFYSTHCPKCAVLQKKLDLKSVKYELVDDVDIMLEKGFQSAPVLVVDGVVYQFAEAIKFVNTL